MLQDNFNRTVATPTKSCFYVCLRTRQGNSVRDWPVAAGRRPVRCRRRARPVGRTRRTWAPTGPGVTATVTTIFWCSWTWFPAAAVGRSHFSGPNGRPPGDCWIDSLSAHDETANSNRESRTIPYSSNCRDCYARSRRYH